ncbi:MAG: gmhB [Phycisphaerales bacterium]|nr:gmhB [Phycisphaerales bacterium]
MRRPAVFFDRDNTLIVGNEYLGDPAGVKLVAGAAGAVATCRNLGYAVVTVSNQSGVARGMFTEDDVAAVDAEMDRQLLEHNAAAVVDRHEYCPHHPDAAVENYRRSCDCRKPKAGMIYTAAEAMALDLKKSWMVGDAPRDVAAGKTAGCRTILIIDPTLPASPAAKESGVTADFTVGSLIEAAEVIAQAAARPMSHPTAFVAPKPPPSVPMPAPVATSTPTTVESLRPRPTAPPTDAAISAAFGEKTAPPPPAVAAAPVSVEQPPAKSVIDRAPVDRTPFSKVQATPVEPSKPPAPKVVQDTAPRLDLTRLEMNSQQILMELKKLNDIRHDDFSISKLVAGITQTLALGALPVAYVLYRSDPNVFQAWLLAAIFLQTFTIAMLVMGRQR